MVGIGQRRRQFSSVLVLALVFGLAGAFTATEAAAQDVRDAAAPAEIKTTLLEPGAGPRSTLRLDLEPGSTQKFEMRTLTKTSMSMGGQQMPAMDLPTVVMPMQAKVGKAEGGDSWNVVMSFDQPRLEGGNPQMAAMMRQSFAGFDALEAGGVVTDQARWRTITFKGEEAMTPQLRDQIAMMEPSIQQFGAVLPNEAVGVGARWRSVQSLDANGIRMMQTTTYTLDAREGDVITLSFDIEQAVPVQVVSLPNAGGAQFETVGTGKGQGKFMFDLSTLMASSGTMTTQSDMSMKSDAANGGMQMEMDIENTVSIKTVE